MQPVLLVHGRVFFFSSRRRHTRCSRDWSSDVCSSDLDETSGAWVDERRRKLFMAVAVPLRASPQAAPQGSLIAAYAIDDTLAHQIRQATTTDVVFFALDTLNRPYIVGSTLPREAVEPALVAHTGAMAAL